MSAAVPRLKPNWHPSLTLIKLHHLADDFICIQCGTAHRFRDKIEDVGSGECLECGAPGSIFDGKTLLAKLETQP